MCGILRNKDHFDALLRANWGHTNGQYDVGLADNSVHHNWYVPFKKIYWNNMFNSCV